MEKEKDRVEIKLNSQNNTYFSGQEISGQICFFLTKKTKIRAIHLQVCAKGKCKWMDIFHKDVNPRHVFYTGKEVYLNDTVNVPYVPARGIELAAGELSMDFTYLLSKDLPSSFKGSYGSIKYKLKVIIQKPWTFDEKYTIPLTIVKHVLSPPTTPQPQIRQTTRNVSVFASGPISLVAELPNKFVIRNEKVTLHVTVDNQSSIHVDKLRFTIVQHVTYYSMKPLPKLKIEEVVIFTKETGGVEKKSERSFAHDLLVPACPPTDRTSIFFISYTLTVEAILPAFYKNLSLSFDVLVYSGDGNNPFEAVDDPRENIFPVCPRLNSFVGISSPSHSQLQNESESSSIYSTTSESSTATLSPAPRVGDFGTLNRASTRSSFRSSRGYQYPSIQGQSLDIHQEYPPNLHPAFTSQIHAPPTMNNSYPPPNIPTLPQYLQSPFFEVQARYPINELPPSYDELFGSASSNSPTAPSPETPV